MEPSAPLTAAEDSAVSVEKSAKHLPSGVEDGTSGRRHRCSEESQVADSCLSPSEERRKFLKCHGGAQHVTPHSDTGHTLTALRREILRMAYNRGGLKFGSFTLKSARQSPFFFNSGCFSDGEAMELLSQAYAMRIVQSGIQFDVLFGAAYKGIPLVACTAMALTRNFKVTAPFAYDRKEPKDHGEGGQLVGALHAFQQQPLSVPSAGSRSSSTSSSISSSKGQTNTQDKAILDSSSSSNSSGSNTRPANVVVIDDVLTAGTAIRANLNVLRKYFPDVHVSAVCLLLDRQERDNLEDDMSASQKLEAEVNTKVLSVLSMADIVQFLEELKSEAEDEEEKHRLEESRHSLLLYLKKYGAASLMDDHQPTTHH